jgi:hypothetical protein
MPGEYSIKQDGTTRLGRTCHAYPIEGADKTVEKTEIYRYDTI